MLPAALNPRGSYDLIRLGNDHDGGYLVEDSSVDNAAVLVSLGIADDWSFDSAFRARNAVPVEAYDHEISAAVLRQRVLWSAPRPRLLLRSLRTLIGYHRFFRGDVRHHELFVGYDGSGSKSLESVLDGHRDVFLKVDIEGWEYRILDQMTRLASRLVGAVIEFHDVDLHRDRLTRFIETFPLHLAHIHGNNHGGTDQNGDPLVVELSFTARRPTRASAPVLPHPLDRPNARRREELSLRFTSEAARPSPDAMGRQLPAATRAGAAKKE